MRKMGTHCQDCQAKSPKGWCKNSKHYTTNRVIKKVRPDSKSCRHFDKK